MSNEHLEKSCRAPTHRIQHAAEEDRSGVVLGLQLHRHFDQTTSFAPSPTPPPNTHLLGVGLEDGHVLRVRQHGLLLLHVRVEDVVVVVVVPGAGLPVGFPHLAVVRAVADNVLAQVVAGTVEAGSRGAAHRGAARRRAGHGAQIAVGQLRIQHAVVAMLQGVEQGEGRRLKVGKWE